MADSTQANGQVVAQGTASADDALKVYATKAEADAALKAMTDPPKTMRAFEVSKAGAVVGWVLGRGYDHALSILARIDGYAVGTGAKVAMPTKESTAAFLDAMDDADRAAFLAKYMPAPAAPKGRKS